MNKARMAAGVLASLINGTNLERFTIFSLKSGDVLDA